MPMAPQALLGGEFCSVAPSLPSVFLMLPCPPIFKKKKKSIFKFFQVFILVWATVIKYHILGGLETISVYLSQF